MILHDRLSVTVMLFVLALGVWGIWNWLRGAGVTGSYWGALAVYMGLIVVEAIVGVILYALGARPSRGILHILYGIVAVIAFPAAYTFTQGRSGRYEALIYAVMALFLAGIALRLRTTGGL